MLAQMLLAPVAALMVVDVATTVKGLARGLCEKNVLALGMMRRFGNVPGIIAYEAIILVIVISLVALFPSQWALPLSLIVELAITVELNRSVLKQHREAFRHEETRKGPIISESGFP